MRTLLEAVDLSFLWIILAAVGGLIIGALIVIFIPLFKNQRANKKAEKLFTMLKLKRVISLKVHNLTVSKLFKK